MLDPTILGPEVADWVDDWSPQESTPFEEDVTSEQNQTLALMSPDDVKRADCVQQSESLAVEANRTLAQDRTALAAASFLHTTFPQNEKDQPTVLHPRIVAGADTMLGAVSKSSDRRHSHQDSDKITDTGENEVYMM